MSGLMNVIQAELFKAVRKKRMFIMAGFLWLLIPVVLVGIGYILKRTISDTFIDEGVLVSSVIETIAAPFGVAQSILLVFGNLSPALLLIIVALIAALMIGEEQSQNMWKTVLTNQPNRITVLTGKLIVAMMLLLVLMLGSVVAAFIFGGIGTLFLPTSFAGDWPGLFGLYGLQWLFGLAAFLYAFLLVWWIRNLPAGIISIFFLPILIEGSLTFYRVVVGFDRINRFNAMLEALQITNTLKQLNKYYFTTNLYGPSRQPLGEFASIVGITDLADAGPFANFLTVDLSRSVWVIAIYALIFGVLLFWSFTRRDVS